MTESSIHTPTAASVGSLICDPAGVEDAISVFIREGSAAPTITIDRDVFLSAGQARELADRLVEAADRLQPIAEVPEYLTCAAAAEWVNSTPWAVLKLARTGALRSVRFGKLLLVCADEVDARREELRAVELSEAELDDELASTT